jgi:AraC-like DNA-binding protein
MTPRDNRLASRATRSSSSSGDGDALSHVQHLRGMFPALEQLGYDIDELLAAGGLRRKDVEDPDAYVSPRNCSLVFTRAQEKRNIKNLALQLVLRTPVNSPLLEYLIVSSDTVEHGLQRLARYLRLLNPYIRILVDETDEPARVVVDTGGDQFNAEIVVASTVLKFTRETDDHLKVTSVSFTHDPDDVSEYASVLRCPVETGAAWNGWALPKTDLLLPLRRRDPALRRWLEGRAVDLLARLPASTDLRDEVRHALTTQMTAGDTSIDAVARRLITAPRTLQRRLAQTGTSFDALRDDVRKRAAEMYLSDATLSITEIAYLLGYSEPTGFHRAFRRWHSTTPEAFRRNLRRATA